jgi:hypothetical protein
MGCLVEVFLGELGLLFSLNLCDKDRRVGTAPTSLAGCPFEHRTRLATAIGGQTELQRRTQPGQREDAVFLIDRPGARSKVTGWVVPNRRDEMWVG